ncbi:hypothetical protein PINS_up001924 [Pythium insidiosum]|nr:hypothetical protein PINS_up001924 [Pythium insidiosum]
MNNRKTANGSKTAGGSAPAAGLAGAATESPSKSPASAGKDPNQSSALPANVQFIPLRSRIGKRFQAVLPELRPKPAPPTSRALDDAPDHSRGRRNMVVHSEEDDEQQGTRQGDTADGREGLAVASRDVMHMPKPRYSIDRANGKYRYLLVMLLSPP